MSALVSFQWFAINETKFKYMFQLTIYLFTQIRFFVHKQHAESAKLSNHHYIPIDIEPNEPIIGGLTLD